MPKNKEDKKPVDHIIKEEKKKKQWVPRQEQNVKPIKKPKKDSNDS